MEDDHKGSNNVLLKYWAILFGVCSVVFATGKLFAELATMRQEVVSLKAEIEAHKSEAKIEHNALAEKQERKWVDIPEIEQRVDDLEEWKAWLEGHENLDKK
jgi:hypothetical protein